MPSIPEGVFNYDFPRTWEAVKFDKLPYYEEKFQSFAGGTKAVDVLAFSGGTELWLIEQKDYSGGGAQTKASELFNVMALKVLGTLACLVAARSNASHGSRSQTLASNALLKTKVRCVLHIEQPVKPSKLFPQVVDSKTAQDALRRVLKAVDRHAIVGNKIQINSLALGWSIS